MASKLKLTLISIGILSASVVSAVALSQMKEAPEKKQAKDTTPLVELMPANLQSVQLDVESYGLVKPKYSTTLTAQVSGQVTELSDSFVKGQFVKKGDVLARIDPNDYEAALIEAEASLAQARAALELERAQKRVAESEWERIKDSSKSEFVPSELYLRKPQLAEKVARYRAAEASVKRATRNLERTYIRAPYDALITDRTISLGSVVMNGAQLGQLDGIKVAEVRLPIPDEDFKYLENSGVNAKVLLSAESLGQKSSWQATIVRSENSIDTQSRMRYLVAEIADPYGVETQSPALSFGAYVTATVSGKALENALLVKRHLVNKGKLATFDSTTSTLKLIDVEVVKEINGNLVVTGALNDEQKLIATHLKYPVDGMKLAEPKAKQATLDTKKEVTQLALRED